MLVAALSTEGTAQPLRSPVAATASAAEPSLAVESPGLGKRRPTAADRTVALRPGGGHQRSPGLSPRVEHRHRNDRSHDPKDTAIISRGSCEVVQAIRILGDGGLEEGQGIEPSGA